MYSSPLLRARENIQASWFTGMQLFWVRHPDELQEQRNRTHVLSVVPISELAGFFITSDSTMALKLIMPVFKNESLKQITTEV